MKQFSIPKILCYMLATVGLYSVSFIVKAVALRNITANIENPIFELDYMTNTGAAFSALAHSSYILAFFALVVLFFLVFYISYNTYRLSWWKIISFAVMSSGIAANLYERLRYGFVTDYIHLKPIEFPVFNFQDILIVLGGIALILLYQFEKSASEELPDKVDEQDAKNDD